jgi:hypothetical protein
MRLTATRRIFAYSGLAPTTDCIVETGVLGGRGPCQSQSKTVPKDPSPKVLIGVNERKEAVRRGGLGLIKGGEEGGTNSSARFRIEHQ